METIRISRDALAGAAAAVQLSRLPGHDPQAWAQEASALLQWAVPHALLTVVELPSEEAARVELTPAMILAPSGARVVRGRAPEGAAPGALGLHEAVLVPAGGLRVYSLWRDHRPFDAGERAVWAEVVVTRDQQRRRGACTPDERLARLAAETALSRQQHNVARRAVAGHSNEAIAAALGVSIETVKTHLAAVYAKTGLRGRKQLTAYAFGAAGVGAAADPPARPSAATGAIGEARTRGGRRAPELVA